MDNGHEKAVTYFKKKDLSGSFRKRYADFIIDTIGKIKILDMPDSISLEKLFVHPCLIDKIDRLIYHDDGVVDSFAYGRRSYRSGREVNKFDINSALSSAKGKMVVLGDPGAGKSTLLRAVALSCFKDSEELSIIETSKYPIYIELRRFADSSKRESSILDYFHSFFDSNDIDKLVVEDLLIHGKCIFLFDALDEVPSAQQNHIVREIEKCMFKYRDCDYIISSRIGDYTHNINNTATYEIAEFDNHKKLEFIKKWFKSTGRIDLSDGLSSVVQESEGISEITTNPLLLSLVCILYSRDLKLPNKRAELYQRCIEVLVREWDTKRGFTRTSAFENLSDKNKIALLCDIAKSFYIEKKRYFKNSALEKLVSDLLPKYSISQAKSAEIIQELCSHYGIIINIGADKIGFSHLSFQEFLTALWYVNRYKLDELALLINKIPRSTEVYVLAAGILDDVSPLLDVVRNKRDLGSFQKVKVIGYILGSGEAVTDVQYSQGIMRHFAILLTSAINQFEVTKIKDATLDSFSTIHSRLSIKSSEDKGYHIKSKDDFLYSFMEIDNAIYSLKRWNMYNFDESYLTDPIKRTPKMFILDLLSARSNRKGASFTESGIRIFYRKN